MHSLTDLRNLIANKYHRICVKLFQGWQLVTNKGTFELGPDGFSKDGVNYSSEKELQADLEHMNHLDRRNRRADADKPHVPLEPPAFITNGFMQPIDTQMVQGVLTVTIPAKPVHGRRANRDRLGEDGPMPAKKNVVKKPATKKAPAKKTAVKKKPSLVKKPATKKAPVKKPATKKKAKKS